MTREGFSLTTKWMIAIALIAAPTSAQAMTVDAFLAKVTALKKKGVFALKSSDSGVLKGEMAGITKAYAADQAAAKKAGRPLACPAPGVKKMSQNEFLAALEAIPPAQRGVSMKTAFYAMLKRKYPCPA